VIYKHGIYNKRWHDREKEEKGWDRNMKKNLTITK
jgi:hypothetical protein